MKITSFNPLIVTKDLAPVVRFFEELGFERRHKIEAATKEGTEITSVRLKNADGFYVDVAQAARTEKDLTLIRMNVPDFDEALAFLKERGFKNVRESDATLETRTNKSAMIVSPSGFAFDLCQHIKD